jgi:hypothetical protein
MLKLTQPQRRVIVILGGITLVALVGLAATLLRSPSSGNDGFSVSPLTPQRVEACREATSDALFRTGQSGMVHAREDGTILIQIQKSVVSESMRQDADATTWAALEAVTSGGECLRLDAVHVTVDYAPSVSEATSGCDQGPGSSSEATSAGSACSGLRVTARVGMKDLVLWSLGEIDDAELSMRVDYHVPVATSSDSAEPTIAP